MVIDPIAIANIAKTAIDVIKFIDEVIDDTPSKTSTPVEVINKPQQQPSTTIVNNFNFYMMGDVEQNKEAIFAAANEMRNALTASTNPFAICDNNSTESK